MYAVHTTPGFIIDSRPRGEGGKLLSIFTRDFGLVLASAQGIRLEKSKLRYYTQDYAMGTYSLVRGKEFWRLTSAAGYATSRGGKYPPESLLESAGKSVTFANSSKGTLLARLALLLRRLLQGEEAHPELFAHIEACKAFLDEQINIDASRLDPLESLTVLRLLHSMGYIGSSPTLDLFLGEAAITPELLTGASRDRLEINKHINKALKESHL